VTVLSGTKPKPMHETASPLTLELLAWISSRPRTYAEAIDAWRSNCPRHPVWDDALSDGLVRVSRSGVVLTAAGEAALADALRA
jgi:hypothetical protein